MNYRYARIPIVKLFGILVFLVFCLSAKAQDFKITKYDIDININKDGSCDVFEKIDVFFFTERRGIFREIPASTKFNGRNRGVSISNTNVKDNEFKVYKENNKHVIRIGQEDKFVSGNQSYVLSYTLSNVFLFTDTHIEFQYDLVTEWPVEIEKASYTINLPSQLDMAFNDYKIITGSTGADERNATILRKNKTFYGESMRSLAPGENISLAMKLPLGYIDKPVTPPSVFEIDKLWIVPLGLIFALFGFFNSSRKEIRAENQGIEYYPPEGFSPAEVGAYHDYRVNTEDLISLLPYWANKGHIKIMASEIGSKELFFKRLTELDSDAPEYQKIIFDEIFKDEDLIMLSELKNKIYTTIGKSRSLIKKRLIDRDLYDEDHFQRYHSGKMILIGIVLIISAILMLVFSPFKLTGIVMIPLGISAFVIHFLRPKRSDKGIMIRSQLKKLKRFLASADPNETKRMLDFDAEYFDKLFPFAIALGVDQTWMNNIKNSDIDFYGPAWYGYNDQSHYNRVPIKNFSSEFSVPEIKSVFTSYPQSSGSGSSGGGGFSGGSAGGGFGGGGGSW